MIYIEGKGSIESSARAQLFQVLECIRGEGLNITMAEILMAARWLVLLLVGYSSLFRAPRSDHLLAGFFGVAAGGG